MPSMYGITLKGHWRRLTWHRLRNFGVKEQGEIRRALRSMAKAFVTIVKLRIRAGKYEKNAHLTKMFKRSRRPLIDSGQLVRAIGYWDLPSPILEPAVFAGINRAQTRYQFSGILPFRTKGFTSMYDLAITLHQGRIIKVKPGMRAHFLRWGMKLKKNAIIIPPRPFIRQPATDPRVIAEMNHIFGTNMTKIWVNMSARISK